MTPLRVITVLLPLIALATAQGGPNGQGFPNNGKPNGPNFPGGNPGQPGFPDSPNPGNPGGQNPFPPEGFPGGVPNIPGFPGGLPNVTGIPGFKPPKDVPADVLKVIYGQCAETFERFFCMGGKGKDIGFPEGKGCLETRDCDALVHAAKLPNTGKGKNIQWELFVRTDYTANFYLSKTEVSGTKLPPNSVVIDSNLLHRVIATDSEGKIIPVTPVDTTSTSDAYVVDLQTQKVAAAGSTPEMLQIFFSSDEVISHSNGYKVDVTNDKLYPVLVIKKGDSNNLINPSAVYLFSGSRGWSTLTIILIAIGAILGFLLLVGIIAFVVYTVTKKKPSNPVPDNVQPVANLEPSAGPMAAPEGQAADNPPLPEYVEYVPEPANAQGV